MRDALLVQFFKTSLSFARIFIKNKALISNRELTKLFVLHHNFLS